MLEANWILLAFIILTGGIVLMYRQFEKKGSDAKEVVLVATMAAIAGISRIPFAAIMSFQPTTFIVMATGYVFGAGTGFIVGSTAALVSNFFLGQGPWTPWQMASWGLCGAIAGLMGRRAKGMRLLPFTVAAFLCGYLFGWIMNLWHWIGFIQPLNIKTFLVAYAASFPFDTLHAAGNVLFSLLFGKSFYSILMRFKRRMHVERVREE